MPTTFGVVRLDGDHWEIACEPQVRARLKRVFPRAPQYAASQIRISATIENSRELEWFLLRFPMEVTPAEELAVRAEAHRAREAQVAIVLDSRRPLPQLSLAKPAREYQLQAAQLLEAVGGLLLGDDVGAGKTVTAICSMANPANRPVLVVCPTHLPTHWGEKLEEFLPGLTVHVLRGGAPYPIESATRDGKKVRIPAGDVPDVIITNYHKLRGWAETLAGVMQYVVFDEVQQLRNSGSSIYKAAKHVAEKARLVLGLSATPIYNYGEEFYWVVDAIRGGALGERPEFIREWCKGNFGEKARIEDPAEFGHHLRREGIMLRRTLSDIGRELLPVTKVTHTVAANEAALTEIQGDAIRLAEVILSRTERYRGEHMQAAGEFDKIVRQATGLAKAPAVAAFVEMLLESEQRVMLFGWHHAVYGIWKELLKEYHPVLYTGDESPAEKARALDLFRRGQSRVLIMSLRSGAGVDGLQDFVRVGVFGELDWSPGVHEQCIGRYHRDDQAEPCVAYFLVADSGADPVMTHVLGIKREQSERVRNPDAALVSRTEESAGGLRRIAEEFLRRRISPATTEPADATADLVSF
jgi:SNF2 family DNA or RNA helicase